MHGHAHTGHTHRAIHMVVTLIGPYLLVALTSPHMLVAPQSHTHAVTLIVSHTYWSHLQGHTHAGHTHRTTYIDLTDANAARAIFTKPQLQHDIRAILTLLKP